MKKRFITYLLFSTAISVLPLSGSYAQTATVSFEKADVNGDNQVDISDVVSVINFMAYGGNNEDPIEKADVNGDNQVDISDVVSVINFMAYDGNNEDPDGIKDSAVEMGLCPDTHHPHAVDLGIGVKFACCNVGASAPWEYGGYYAWGETQEKVIYDKNSYIFYDTTIGNFGAYQNIGSDIGGTDYDVAHVNWGGFWRMPTFSQIDLLRSSCSSQGTFLNGVSGRKFTGPSGKSLFLPAVGCYKSFHDRTRYEPHGVRYSGYYWSSTQESGYSWSSGYPSNAYSLSFGGNVGWEYEDRSSGLCVRPVTE